MRLAQKLSAFERGEIHLLPANIDAAAKAMPRNLYFEEGSAIHAETLIPSLKDSSFIGAHSYINPGSYLRGNIFIARYCSIGRRVSLGAGLHPTTGVSTSPSLFPRNHTSPAYTKEQMEEIAVVRKRSGRLVIESDVWIGDGAIIMPGVRIGVGAVIAANAIVTENVLPYQIVGGMPAKPIKQRFSDRLIEKLLQSEWWELGIKNLDSLPVGNVFSFLEALAVLDCPLGEYPTFLSK